MEVFLFADFREAFLFLVLAAFLPAALLLAAFLRLVAAAFLAAALLLALEPLRAAGFLLAVFLLVVLFAGDLRAAFLLTDFLLVLAILFFPLLVVFLVFLPGLVLRVFLPFGGLTNTSSPSAIVRTDCCLTYNRIVVDCIAFATQTPPLALR